MAADHETDNGAAQPDNAVPASGAAFSAATPCATGAPVSAAPLAGYHLLVTRPQATAEPLCAALRATGATVFFLPLLTIDIGEATPAQREIAQQLDRFEIVIVTSRHAVAAALPLLADYWPQWPAAQAWLAVGHATATALAEYGIAAGAPADARTEGLLELPLLADVAGRRILLIAGEGGRPTLTETLTARGAQVTRLALYRRVAATDANNVLDAFRDIHAGQGRRVALVTSAEALQNLLALAPWLPESDVVVQLPSERIAALAHKAGIRDALVAHGAGDAEQISALLQRAASG